MSVIGLEVGSFEIVAPVELPGPSRWYLATRSGPGTAPEHALVALLPPGADARAALRRQHDVLRALDDPRLPRVLALYEELGALVLAHGGGAALSGAIRGRLRGEILMTPATLLDLVFEIAEVLQLVHQRGWFHGHLSPDHVWLTVQGEIRLLGLGEDPAHRRSLWCAPEQARGDGSGPWTDQWGLAALATALVSGRPPWAGPEPLRQARRGDPGPVVEPVSQQWPALARVLRRMLDPDPGARFQDLRAVRHQLLPLARRARSTSERRDLGAWLSTCPPPGPQPGGAQQLEAIDTEASVTLVLEDPAWPDTPPPSAPLGEPTELHTELHLGPPTELHAGSGAPHGPDPHAPPGPHRPHGSPGPPEPHADVEPSELTVLFQDSPQAQDSADPDLELTELALSDDALNEISRVTTASELQALLGEPLAGSGASSSAPTDHDTSSSAPTEPLAPPRTVAHQASAPEPQASLWRVGIPLLILLGVALSIAGLAIASL